MIDVTAGYRRRQAEKAVTLALRIQQDPSSASSASMSHRHRSFRSGCDLLCLSD